jgi:hypothetical protein
MFAFCVWDWSYKIGFNLAKRQVFAEQKLEGLGVHLGFI